MRYDVLRSAAMFSIGEGSVLHMRRMTVDTRRLLAVPLTVLGLILALSLGHAASSKVSTAQAYSDAHFCAVPEHPVGIYAGQRCVDPYRLRHRYIRGTIHHVYGTGQFCVGAKQYGDGTGANTKYFGCHIPSQYPGYNAISPVEAAPGSPLGYATIINNTGSWDEFHGYMQWYP